MTWSQWAWIVLANIAAIAGASWNKRRDRRSATRETYFNEIKVAAAKMEANGWVPVRFSWAGRCDPQLEMYAPASDWTWTLKVSR